MALQARHRFRPAPSIALLFILPLVSLCNTNSYQHFPESAVSYTGRCAQNWCGETWYVHITICFVGELSQDSSAEIAMSLAGAIRHSLS